MKIIETYFVKKENTKTVWKIVDKIEKEISFDEYFEIIQNLKFFRTLNGSITVRKKGGKINKIFFNELEKQNKSLFEIIFNN